MSQDSIDAVRKLAAQNIQQSAKAVLFIRGPLELNWFSAAAELPGKALAVGLAIWWRYGLTKEQPVKLPLDHCKRFGVRTRKGRLNALKALQAAGLVAVETSPTKSPQVTLQRVSEKTRKAFELR